MKFLRNLKYLFSSRYKQIDMLMEDALKDMHQIEIFNDGFSISKQSSTIAEYRWANIYDMTIGPSQVDIMNRKEIIGTVPDTYAGYHAFIQSIPEKYKSFDYAYVRQFFAQLEGCPCCGLMAVHEGSCLNCAYDNWDIVKDETNLDEQTYLYEKQFLYFEPIDENDTIEIKNDPAFGFKSDPNWKPIVKPEHYIKADS